MTEEEYREAVDNGARLNAALIRYRMKPDCRNDFALAAAISVRPYILKAWLDGESLPDLRSLRLLAGVTFSNAAELLVYPAADNEDTADDFKERRDRG